MGILLMSALPGRVIEVLQDYLPDELDLVDADAADGFETPNILEANYFETDKLKLDQTPALTIRTVASTPVEVLAASFGERIDARHDLEIMVHVSAQQGLAEELQKLMHRYAAGIVRVLTVTHPELDTVADPVRFVEMTEWTSTLSYSPEPAQHEGAIVRTVTIPLSIRLRETRL